MCVWLQVHPYISTGMASSKFGIRNTHLDWFLAQIKDEPLVELVGVHCHLGSTIKEVRPFEDAAGIMCDFVRKINAEGFQLQYLNFGGGLGIDYSHTGEQYPRPKCAPPSQTCTAGVAMAAEARHVRVAPAVLAARSAESPGSERAPAHPPPLRR